MISALERFDRVTAAGILARAALAISDYPQGELRLADEASVRDLVLDEARRKHGIRPDDTTPETLDRLGEILDSERESLIAPADSNSVLARLSERGDLPSDLFKVEIINSISEFHGSKFSKERKLIEQTVKDPDREQHYGPPEDQAQPFLISLFAKEFRSQYPNRTFTLLVAGQRDGIKLEIHQAWRVYPSEVQLEGAETLIDMLKKFSDVYGVEINLGAQKGHFILLAAMSDIRELQQSWDITAGEPQRIGHNLQRYQITVTCFAQKRSDTTYQAALAVAIDLNRYRRLLESQS